MRRRDFITLLGGSVTAWPLGVQARQPDMPVIGFLNSGSSGDAWFAKLLSAFRDGLKTVGYVEGQNVTIDFRWAEGDYGRLSSFATQLVHRGVSVISAGGPPAATAAKAATSTIPIVFTVGADPVKLGLVASFNQPGGNATGVSLVLNEAEGKRLGLLHELLPRGSTVAVILNAKSPAFASQLKDIQSAARSLNQQIDVLNANSGTEIEAALADALRMRASALLIGSDPFYATQQERFITFAARHALPAAYDSSGYGNVGGLLSYGIDVPAAYRQAGAYVGRVLKGERPSELPVVRLDKFYLVINNKTAKSLGLEIPSGVMAIADEVIE